MREEGRFSVGDVPITSLSFSVFVDGDDDKDGDKDEDEEEDEEEDGSTKEKEELVVVLADCSFKRYSLPHMKLRYHSKTGKRLGIHT
jgi:hypothetical protein